MKINRDDAPILNEADFGTLRGAECGGMLVSFAQFEPGTDLSPVLEHLAAGGCHVPHWGYVIEGSLTIGYPDGSSETVVAGDAFHAPAVHDKVSTETGVLFVEVSSAAGMQEVMSEINAIIEST